MSDHRPECFYYMDDFGDGERCICDRLRACEQRVREDERAACIAAIQADGLGAEWRVERIIKLLGEV